MYKHLIALAILVTVVAGFHLEKAKVIGKVGQFLRKQTKFGDVYLHREH